MKKFTKLILMSVCMLLVAGIMAFGVYAASLQRSTFSANISFVAESVSLEAVGMVYGTTAESDPVWERTAGAGNAVLISANTTWGIGTVSFKQNNPNHVPVMTFCIAIRNISGVAIQIKPRAVATSVSNTTISYKQKIYTNVTSSLTVSNITGTYHSDTLTNVTNTWSGSTYTGSMGATNMANNTVYYFEITYTVTQINSNVPSTAISLPFDAIGL